MLLNFLIVVLCLLSQSRAESAIYNVENYQFCWSDTLQFKSALQNCKWAEKSASDPSLAHQDAYLWLKINVDSNDIEALSVRIRSYFRAYSPDGRLLSEFEPVNNKPQNAFGGKRHLIYIKNNPEVYFVVTSASGSVGFENQILSGTFDELTKYTVEYNRPQLFVGLFLIVIGLGTLTVYIFYFSKRDILYIAGFSSMAGIWTLSMMDPFMVKALLPFGLNFWIQAVYWSTYAGIIFLFGFFNHLDDVKGRKLLKAFEIYFMIFFATAISLHVMGIQTLRSLNLPYNLSVLVSSLVSVLVFGWSAISTRSVDSVLLLVGILVLEVLSIFDSFFYMRLFSAEKPIAHYGFLFLTGIQLCIFSRKIGNTRRRNEEYIKEINAKNEELTTLMFSLAESERTASVGRIVNQISHDLRAPLGIFERLLMTGESEIPKMRASIRDALNRVYAMVEALRYSETEHLINRSTASLDFTYGLGLLQNKATARNIRIISSVENIRIVNLDVAKIERAWINLVSNAIDFAKSEVRLEAIVKGGDLILRIIDNGVGVPNEFLPKLFQRGATHGKADGTGLGLAYVRQIMRGHGGDVTYRRENNLTIFECRLPHAVQPEKEQVMDSAASLETQLIQQQVRSVAICLKPRTLTRSVLAKLTSYESGGFLFTEERDGATVVVSNIDEVMFEVLERDDQEYLSVSHLKQDEGAILRILKRRFHIETEGGSSV